MKAIVAVLGPTAVGKTAVGIALAQALEGEILSCDSMQVYRHLSIGTAKPTEAEKAQAIHHGIDLIEPEESLDAFSFQSYADEIIAGIDSRGRRAILVGGTGLYLQAVLEEQTMPPVGEDPNYRQTLHSQSQREGNEAVHAQLAQVDPLTAARLHPNDLRRVIRALEVYHQTGQPISSLQSRSGRLRYPTYLIGLRMERQTLYQRINRRVDQMIQEGLLDEVQTLMARGVENLGGAAQAIGYKEFIQYFQGQQSLEEAIEEVKKESRRYAKRQLSWFGRDPRIRWFQTDEGLEPVLAQILDHIHGTKPLI